MGPLEPRREEPKSRDHTAWMRTTRSEPLPKKRAMMRRLAARSKNRRVAEPRHTHELRLGYG